MATPVTSEARPLATHPVTQVLQRRARAGSRPGARDDGHRVALVLEGGGMRGVVSAGMTAAIERLGLTQGFDLVAGASAGAINGAALLAGAAGRAVATYTGPLASRAFINPFRRAARQAGARRQRHPQAGDRARVRRATTGSPAARSACTPSRSTSSRRGRSR